MNATKGRKPGFAEWMRAVDAAVEKRAGVSVHDLPDVDFIGMYEDGAKPASAARAAIRNAKGEGDF